MKKIGILCLVLFLSGSAMAQEVLTLDSCRNRAIRYNKQLQIGDQRIEAAKYMKKSAFANYLPKFDVAGAYMYNQRNISLLSKDAYLPVMNFDGTGYKPSVVMAPDGKPVMGPNGQPIPTQVALIPKEAFEFDVHNTFMGAITLTQPIYMGGKIMAYNKITQFAEELAKSQQNSAVKDVVFKTDELYWQTVSLVYKKRLAERYLELLQTLHNNINEMIKEGVATKSDELTVAVKLNEAEVTMTKVDNGLILTKMALAQQCGMVINGNYTLADEQNVPEIQPQSQNFTMDEVFSQRSEITSLEWAKKIYEKKQRLIVAEMLPQVALAGNYLFSNPNVYNGFENKFKGMFNVGVMVKIPVFHWGESGYKLKAAKAETNITHLELEEAKEKIELQVSQAVFKVQEASRTLAMTEKNREKADENLNNAQIGFKEGVLTTTNVLEAQTAWLQAESERIDAQIEMRLCDVYLSKALGTMNINSITK